jgi:hypothetical protein
MDQPNSYQNYLNVKQDDDGLEEENQGIAYF